MSSNASDVPRPGKPARRSKRSRSAAKSEAAVKRPAVKLPDQVYEDQRPADFFAPYHQRTRDHEPEWIYEVVRVFVTFIAVVVFRARAFDSQNVPNGPVIIAPNHASFMDHFLCAAFIRRHVQFMAKSHMFKRRSVKTWVYTHGGAFPVRRGGRDEDVFVTAHAVLRRGGCLGMYVEGGRTRSGEMSTEAKPGLGRLALESGAAIVPVAIVGSHQIRDWKRLHFPKVSVHYGAPLAFSQLEAPTRGQAQAAANEVLERIRALHEQNA